MAIDPGAIRVVLFDLDDTLIVQDDADWAALCAICSERCDAAPEALAATVRREAQQQWAAGPHAPYCAALGISAIEGLWASFAGNEPALEALKAWTPSYRRRVWETALVASDRTAATAEELGVQFGQERRARQWLFPETLEVLMALRRQGYALGLITNGAPDLQREKLGAVRLSPYFEAIVVSGEVAIGKPDPGIFTPALQALGVTPGEVLMVGNSLAHDIKGARNAGVPSVWINRSGTRRNDTDPLPDAEIERLTGLFDLLAPSGGEVADIPTDDRGEQR